MKVEIMEMERSPFNKLWMLKLACGHTVWHKRKPQDNFTYCPYCHGCKDESQPHP